MKLFIDSTNYTHLLIDPQITKKLSYLGRITANQGTLTLDGVQSYALSGLENKTVVLKDDDDNPIFTGVTLKGKTTVDAKTVQLPIKDKWHTIKDTSCTNKTWKDASFKTIVEDIIDLTGETSYVVEDPTLTVTWFSTNEKDKVRDVLEELAKSIGAYCYYDSSGTLRFTAGFNSSFSTSTVADFNHSMASGITTERKANDYDYSEVAFVLPEFKANMEQIYNGASKDNSWLIGASGIGTSDEYRIKLDYPVYELDSYSGVTFVADSELTFDQTTYESNFQTGTQPQIADSVKVKITNSSALTQEVREFILNGKVIRMVEGTAKYSTGSKPLSNTSEVVTDATWAGKLAQYNYEQLTDVETIEINLAELDYTLELMDKFTYNSTRYVIDYVSIKNGAVWITGFKDRDSAFSYTSSSVTYTRESEETSFADGLAPATPTGLSLSSTFADDTCFVKAQWDANTEDDMKGYELQWSYDNSTWYTIGVVVDTEKSFEVRPDKTVYVKIRATDIEGLESAWSSAVSVSTATGEETPEAPTSLSVNASPMTLELDWDCDTNTLFWRFEVQRSLSSPVSYSTIANTKATQYVDLDVSASNTYIYRVRTVDIFENASAWVSATAGYTPEIAVTTDGTAPSTPTGLSLSSDYAHDKSYVTASWSANSESDIKGYSVRWSYDNATWRNAGMTAETSLGFEVRSNQTIFVQVRSTDVEGFESSWSGSASVTSTEDSNAPATPSSITSTAKVETIEVNWAMTPEYDLDYFKVERAVSPYTSYSEVAKVKGNSYVDLNVVNGTYYKYRVKAYDYSGNASSYRTTSSGVTPNVYLGGDGAAPNAPTGLTVSTWASSYKSIIYPDWNASTSIDVKKYVVEYKQQGVTWGNATQKETNGLSMEIEVEPRLYYDVRVKAVDVEEKSSSWATGSVKSSAVSGDGSLPPVFRFDDSQCSASIINQKKLAYLKWYASSVSDIEKIIIKYANNVDKYDYAISRTTSGLWFNSNFKEKEFKGDVREAYIEVDTSAVWTFVLLALDYDGYVRSYYTGSTDDGVLQLDFTSVSLESTPGTPSMAYNSYSTSDYSIIWRVRAPSGVGEDWKLVLQQKEQDDDSTETEYTIKGDEGYRYVAYGYYYIKTFYKPSAKDQVYQAKAKFVNNEAEEGSWSSTATCTIPGGGFTAPNAPTSLSLSTSQSSYKSIITASWTASTSSDVVSYEIQYKQQGKTWADSASTTVRDATSEELEVEENLHYDVRVRAVSEYELNSSWVSSSVKAYNVSGDGSEPNSYVFDDSECEAVVLNGKRYAHLKWMAESTASPDIKNFHIRYADDDDDLGAFWVTESTINVYMQSDGYDTKTVSGDVFEAYIEIPNTNSWNFMLYAEDYDGYIHNSFLYSFTSGDQTDDALIQLDFSSTTIGVTPGTPSISSVSTGFTTMIVITFTPPSNVNRSWDLEAQFSEAEDDWGNSATFSGEETYQWKSTQTYKIRCYLYGSAQAVKVRIRFVNNKNNVAGNWDYGYGYTGSFSPTVDAPSSITTSKTWISSITRYAYQAHCPPVEGATGYEWKCTDDEGGDTIVSNSGSVSATTNNEVTWINNIGGNRDWVHVRAKKELHGGTGYSSWTTVGVYTSW